MTKHAPRKHSTPTGAARFTFVFTTFFPFPVDVRSLPASTETNIFAL
jgi:hypothetical protein